MPWHQSIARDCKKTAVLKAKVTPSLKERAEAAAAEDELMLGTWVREAIVHVLTMREVKDRIEAHRSEAQSS